MTTSIIEKIRKLMTLAKDRGATPAEAANAAQKIHELLFAHNLSMADVKEPGPEHDVKMTLHDVVGPQISRTARHLLMHVLTQHNFCESIADTKRHRHILIGKPHNVAVCLYMYDHIGAAIQIMARSAAKENGGDKYVAYFNAFWRGACQTIHDRLTALRERECATTAGNALVVQSAGELEAANCVYSEPTQPSRSDTGPVTSSGIWMGEKRDSVSRYRRVFQPQIRGGIYHEKRQGNDHSRISRGI